MANYANLDDWLIAIERAISMGLRLTDNPHDQSLINHMDLIRGRLKLDRDKRAAGTPYTVATPKPQQDTLIGTTETRYQGTPCPGCGTSVVEIEGQQVEITTDGWLGMTHRCPEGDGKR